MIINIVIFFSFDIFLDVDHDYGLTSLDRSIGENFVFDEYDLSLFFFPSSYLYDTSAIKQDDDVVVVVVCCCCQRGKRR